MVDKKVISAFEKTSPNMFSTGAFNRLKSWRIEKITASLLFLSKINLCTNLMLLL